MFLSTDHHKAIFTKPRIRYMQCKEYSCNMGFNKTYECIKVY